MKEIRYLPAGNAELRTLNEKPLIVGYAAVFNSLSNDLGGFREMIQPGAFTDTLAAGADVRALIDHDPSLIIGRSKAGTLSLKQDDTGLLAEIMPPDTTVGRDVTENLRLKNLDGMSFAFCVVEDAWSIADGETIRELIRVELFDVSVVSYPAYPDTSVALRSLDAWKQAAFDPDRYALLKRKLALSAF